MEIVFILLILRKLLSPTTIFNPQAAAVEYPHGVVRLEGFKSAIMADAAYDGGNYTEPPTIGLRAGGTHWSSWSTSQEWFRTEKYRDMGLDSTQALVEWWQQLVLSWDANDLIALANTWQGMM